MPNCLRPPSRARFVALVLFAAVLGHAGGARASTVYAGTKGGTSRVPARVLRWDGGTTWTDISAGMGFTVVWDLEWHDGALWACGASTSGGFVGRWDGSDWEIWAGPADGLGAGAVTGLGTVGDAMHAGVAGVGLVRLDGATWQRVASITPIARVQGDECGTRSPLIFMGGDVFDDFWVHDPTGALACGASCPDVGGSGGACPAGCHGGSCIHSMAWHTEGSNASVYSGAYSGEMYVWNWTSRRFERMTRAATSGNVQALASFRGNLHAGLSTGRLMKYSAPSWSEVASFGNDEPVSALAHDADRDLLWIGHGGVPFGFARSTGDSMIRTWDGTTLVDRGTVGQFGTGVPALLVAGSVGGSECDAGPPQVVECAGASTAVTLRGTGMASADCSAAAPTLTWTGGFIEGTATGGSPTVHFDAPGTYPIDLQVSGGLGVRDCETSVTVRDTRPPVISAPASMLIGCNDPLPPAIATADDACDASVALDLEQEFIDGPCPQSWSVVRTWTATDASGNTSSVSRRIDVVDADPPSLSGLPVELTSPCPVVPDPPVVLAEDECDPDVPVTLDERRVDGPCPGTYDLVRTWSATDDCGHAVTESRVVHVVDDVAPRLSGVPADATVACDAVPSPATPTSDDDCDDAPTLTFAEVREDGPCPHSYRLLRTWAAEDDCGNAVDATQAIDVIDSQPPRLVGVPADVVVECPSVPPVAPVTAEDGCDAVPALGFTEVRVDGRCPGEYQLLRTWTATDACGNGVSATQVVQVVDTTPPDVTAGGSDLHVLWPPNHRMVTFGQDDFVVVTADACSGPVTWRLSGCASDQPENDLGDGNTAPDCEVAPDGSSFAVRAERQGTEPAGRRYAVSVVATDACGNESAPTVIGYIRVPHDQRNHER